MTTQAKTVPHIHAEVLRAIADGKVVQFRKNSDAGWVDRGNSPCAPDPITNVNEEWRVKPEVKPDIKAKGRFYYSPRATGNWDYISCPDVDNVQFTFCGETHKLIKVELIEEGDE